MNKAALSLECVADRAAFCALRDEWRELHASCPQANPFNSWEWLFSWWQAYGAERTLRVLVWRAAGRLAGVAPLYLAPESMAFGASAQVLRMVGDGSGDSDYLAFLVRGEYAAPAMAQLGQWLAAEPGWDALAMSELKPGQGLLERFGQIARQHRFALRIAPGRCSAVELPATFAQFLEARQPRFRTRIRALLKKLDADPALRFEPATVPDDLRARLRSLYALHQARWAAEGVAGVFRDARRRLFYGHFVPRFARRGWLRVYSLRHGQTYVAHQLCFGGEGITYLLQEGFDVSNPAASYGQMLRAAVMRHLIANGERSYDFLGGYSRHKHDWGARESETANAVIARRRWRGRLYANAPAWRQQLADAANRFLPQTAMRVLRRTRDLVA